VLPAENNPVVYFRAEGVVGPRKTQALRNHLQEAWEVLRPNQKVSWEWLENLKSDPATQEPPISSSSFLTTPITRGTLTEGFFTILPTSEQGYDEPFLQSFFVVGDLLSVLLYNLHLREKLEERATTDGLTGLVNRQALMEALEKECRRSQRYGDPVSVVMLDLDHFKSINDRFGHQAGDHGLRHVAEKIMQGVRESDLAGRCGGEEFIVILPQTDLEGARTWAERLRQDLEKHPLTYRSHTLPITASMGVASGSGPDAVVDGLVLRADAGLYRAKSGGRNRVCVVRADEKVSSGEFMNVSQPPA
jgi:diguanylate cyclase (GGDEF)-like protein